MTSVTLKAKVSQVPFGGMMIEGLLLENGEFGIAQQQIATLFSVIPTSAPKWLETRLGKAFQLFQVKTDRPKQAGKQNRCEKALSLAQFETLLRKLDREGNETARTLVDSLIGLSLTQIFSDAFNLEFNKEDRIEYLKSRFQGKLVRRTLTDSIKKWLESQENVSENTKKFIYSNVSDCLNVALFGKKAKQLCEERNVDKSELRDSHDSKSLKQIEYHENFAMKLIDKTKVNPLDAIKEAVEFFKD